MTTAAQSEITEQFLIDWERELRAKAGEIGQNDRKAFRLAEQVAQVRRALQEQFGLVST